MYRELPGNKAAPSGVSNGVVSTGDAVMSTGDPVMSTGDAVMSTGDTVVDRVWGDGVGTAIAAITIARARGSVRTWHGHDEIRITRYY